MHFQSTAEPIVSNNQDYYRLKDHRNGPDERPIKSQKSRKHKSSRHGPANSMGPRSFTTATLLTQSDCPGGTIRSGSSSHQQMQPAIKTSLFEQFIKKSIKVDLFNLTYQDDVFAENLRQFIPKSDFFIKPDRAVSPIAIGDDGSVYTAWRKPENRKKRKSQKLEFLTNLLDKMMAAIL